MSQPQPSPFDVIRSLDKRRREYRRIGWVYMLKNSAFKKPLLKIGRTARSPMERAHELGTATGVPEGFELVYFVHVSNRNDAERDVHHALDRYRQSHKKEFFEVSLRTAIQALDRVADTYPIVVGRGSRSWVLPQYFQPLLVLCPSCGKTNRVKPLRIRRVTRPFTSVVTPCHCERAALLNQFVLFVQFAPSVAW